MLKVCLCQLNGDFQTCSVSQARVYHYWIFFSKVGQCLHGSCLIQKCLGMPFCIVTSILLTIPIKYFWSFPILWESCVHCLFCTTHIKVLLYECILQVSHLKPKILQITVAYCKHQWSQSTCLCINKAHQPVVVVFLYECFTSYMLSPDCFFA